jgi:hypothetical protein
MFAQLKGVVDVVRAGVVAFRQFKSKRERDGAVVDLLKFYFLLQDCVDEGELLVAEAGNDPVAKISAMGREEAAATAKRWEMCLRRQGIRLRLLEGHIFGQHHLCVVNPKLQKELAAAIGNKMQRAVTLYGIGASLYVRALFADDDTNDAKAHVVTLMAGGGSSRTLDVNRVRREISRLRRVLVHLRSVVR